jgi:hypothetical protein
MPGGAGVTALVAARIGDITQGDEVATRSEQSGKPFVTRKNTLFLGIGTP